MAKQTITRRKTRVKLSFGGRKKSTKTTVCQACGRRHYRTKKA